MSVCRDQEEQPFADVLQNVFGVFKYFEKLTGKDLRWSLFLIKLQALTPPQLFTENLSTENFQTAAFI